MVTFKHLTVKYATYSPGSSIGVNEATDPVLKALALRELSLPGQQRHMGYVG